MQSLIKKFEDYLLDVLGISVFPKIWQTGERLPFYLRDLYKFFHCSLFNKPVLLLVERQDEEQTPGTVSKHIEQIRKQWEHQIIYVASSITSYNRKRFIENKLPFVVPNNQMYLPPLGIDLREYIKTKRVSTNTKISPSTQTVILHALVHEPQMEFTPSFLAHQLGYSLMTMTRAFDELKVIGLGNIVTQGRERILRFNMNRKALWQESQRHLHSPVKKFIYTKPPLTKWLGVLSGLSALSRYSMLAQPINSEYALSTTEWKRLKQTGDLVEFEAQELEPWFYKVEIWNYDPHLFAQNDIVDPYSLYLSLKNTIDERVEGAIEEMMETIQW